MINIRTGQTQGVNFQKGVVLEVRFRKRGSRWVITGIGTLGKLVGEGGLSYSPSPTLDCAFRLMRSVSGDSKIWNAPLNATSMESSADLGRAALAESDSDEEPVVFCGMARLAAYDNNQKSRVSLSKRTTRL
jgi:hypothetical protein